MNYVSLCTGIGGLDLGLDRAGMTCILQCENNPDALRVLVRHWPDVPKHHDLTTLTAKDIHGHVDLICGGTPCQDLSVAGDRAGLAGEQSRLFFEFMRVVDQVTPRWVLWENVPGLLSSHKGKDMGIVVGTLADLGYGWAYRVLDSQYFGVAQRRRRVFLVGCAGDPAGAAQILFEPESCDRDLAPRPKTGTRVAASLTAGTARGRDVNPPGRRQEDDINIVTVGTLGGTPPGGGWRFGADEGAAGHLIPDTSAALTAQRGQRNDPTEATFLAYSTKLHNTRSNQAGKFYEEHTPSLQADSPSPVVAYRKAAKPHGLNDAERWEETDHAQTINGWDERHNPPAHLVAFSVKQENTKANGRGSQENVSHGPQAERRPAVHDGMQVRRLTPQECERLQGFPDGWTDQLADSARYRTLGNAVTVNVAEWIGRRIVGALR